MDRIRAWIGTAVKRTIVRRALATSLQREIEAMDKFPDQNPNPVMRMARDGSLLYANVASAPIAATWGVRVGDRLPADVLGQLAAAAAASPERVVEVENGWRTFAVLPVSVKGFDFLNLYGTDITAAKVVERFPDRNPNPVMRMSPEGTLLYANAASTPLTGTLGLSLGGPLPTDLAVRLRDAGDQAQPASIEIQGDGRTYALKPVSIPEFGFINVYGTDVTASKAINKFPDQNPNPVLRVSREGRLLYGNPASAPVRRAFGAEVGEELSADLCRRILEIAEAESPEILELESDGRLYALLVVPVYEFGFINVYGTDITAAREVERLLLNILPASIVERLRGGEVVIADRFDEMAVLFADVVGFTKLSSRLSAIEVVETLNGIFSIFDRLADRYGLEKIKTIGDAYMVVGGLTPGTTDHAERMADMALEMIGGLASYRSETGLEVAIRVGIHAGPAVAGVIGLKKFIYDVWGDTVNMASRMESLGLPGRIHVSESTYDHLKDRFVFEAHEPIEVKGKGLLGSYFLVARRGSAGPDPA